MMEEPPIRIEDVLNGKYRYVEGKLVRRSYVDMESIGNKEYAQNVVDNHLSKIDERTEKLKQDALKYEGTTMAKAFDWFCKHCLEYIKAEPHGSCAVAYTVKFADMWEAYKKVMEE